MDILELTIVLVQEIFMSDEKLTFLRQSHSLHPHPEEVRDPLFTSGSPFSTPATWCKSKRKNIMAESVYKVVALVDTSTES